MQHINIIVHGKVQGVFFRASTKVVANQLGIYGFIRNQPDGSVYIEAEGDNFSLSDFLEWCHEGPDDAKVEEVSYEQGELQHYRNFEIVKK